MTHFTRDILRSLKLLGKDKTFSATVLVTLALCLGANVAIYSVVHAVLLKPLPFRQPDRLVTVYNSYPGAGAARGGNGVVDFFERRENVAAFDDVAIYRGSGNTVGEPGSTERAASMMVTPSFFPLLGIQAEIGRTFTEEEMEVGNEREVVLSHAAWEEYFGSAPDVIGRDLRIDGRPYQVVGVLDSGFSMPNNADARLFLPAAFTPEDRQLDNWHSNNFDMIARLAPGATVEQAVAQNDALNNELIDRWAVPNARQILQDAGYHAVVVPTTEDLVRDIRPVLYMLWAGVTFVLLIGCVNIANLILARAQTRITDMATRLALGASRGRVAAQVLAEALVLSVVGGVLGLGVGAFGLRLLRTLGAADLPRGAEIGIDLPVLLFTLGLSLGASALFAVIPMVSVMRGDLSPAFRAGGRTGTASRRSVLVRNALVTSQVGLAFVMLIGAGLMLVSFRSAISVNPGFDPRGLFTGYVSLPSARYADADARRRFWDQLVEEVRTLPRVADAAVTSQLPFTSNRSSSVIMPEGYELAPGESLLSPLQTVAGPGYFETMGIPLLQGRTFEDADGPETTRVIVIDQWLADRYWPSGDAIGHRMVYGTVPGADSVPEESLYTVVGVVQTVKQNDLTAPASEHVGAYYFTYRQQPRSFMTLAARSVGVDPGVLTSPIREALTKLDPELPLFDVESMADRIDDSLMQRRVPLVLLGVFASVALFLAVVGIYGALAYTVTQRTREIGIRMAMGSAPRQVFGAVVAQGLRVTAFGLVVGGVGAVFLTRLIQSLLFDVQATDPRIMVGVAILLGLVAAAACMVPARRATRVDPVEALGG